jgi:hypothetical protein
MTRLLGVVLLSCAGLSTAAGHQPCVVPSECARARIVIVAGDTGYAPRSDSLAALLSHLLQHPTTPRELRVVPLRDIEAALTYGGPQPSTHEDFLELARLLRADVVVDVVARETAPPPEALGRAITHYPSDAPPDTFFVEGRTDSALADALARELVKRARIERRYAVLHRPRATQDTPPRR